MGMHTPHFGYNVTPKAASAGGTSLLHGNAQEMMAQNAWICASTTEQPSHSKHLNPQTPNGTRHGAPGLQQNSQLNVQSPTFPDFHSIKQDTSMIMGWNERGNGVQKLSETKTKTPPPIYIHVHVT